MELKNFKATNVHGYLNYNIEFHSRLTFLIGINGTGKTSVLKLILGLISPSFNYLNSIEFDSAELICKDSMGSDIFIKATKNTGNNNLDLYLKKADAEYKGMLEKTSIALINNEIHNEDTSDKLRGLIDRFDQQDLVKEIKSLSTPLFLGLDRRAYEGQQIDKMKQGFLLRRRYINFPQNDPLNIGLMDMQEVIYDYMRLIASNQPKINEEFKNKILLQSFEFLENQAFNSWKDAKELDDKRKKASDAFNNLKIVGFSDHVNKFFDQLSITLNQFYNVQKNRKKNAIEPKDIEIIQKWFNNQPQLKRIDELIEYNQAYQNEIQKLYLPIEQTKDIINKFFNESKKELQIDAQGELQIKFKNGKIAKLYELSSGEKQIITMLGHLIFFEERFKKDTGIFIIDEPEVSLHLAWQEIFVNSILEASPKTQFILATHSPAILGDFDEDLCEDLAKLN